jgi:hypothetical protein
VVVEIRGWLFIFGRNAEAVGENAQPRHPRANAPVSCRPSRRAALDNAIDGIVVIQFLAWEGTPSVPAKGALTAAGRRRFIDRLSCA